MELQTDTSYQYDILRMNKICKHLQKCDKENKQGSKKSAKHKQKLTEQQFNQQAVNKRHHNKQSNPNRRKCTQAPKPSPKGNTSKQSSTNNKNPMKDDQIIQFSTEVKPAGKGQMKKITSSNQLLIQNTRIDKQNPTTIVQRSQGNKNSQRNQVNQTNEGNPKSENIAHNSNAYRQIHELKQKIQGKDQQLALLRVNNQRYRDLIDSLEQDIREKNQIIDSLKQRQHQLLGETNKFKSKNNAELANNLQYINYKNDAKRLLKMLKATQQYQSFASLALDDNGVRFLHEVNKKQKKSALDIFPNQNCFPKPSSPNTFHFCSCNKQFIPEANFWIPEKAYDFSKQFAKQTSGQVLTNAQLQLFLYELNKIWRQREKRIINSLNSLNAHGLNKYKRKIQQTSHSHQRQFSGICKE